jgi:HAD superfamily hydrolase (TIGR01484 family)
LCVSNLSADYLTPRREFTRARPPQRPTSVNPYSGIILSDLDGTFLDESYCPVLTAPELASVVTRWRVIWVTSRTVDEIRWLQRSLEHRDDAIAENGGVCLTHSGHVARTLGNAQEINGAFVSVLGGAAQTTLALVDDAFASVGRGVRTFVNLSPIALAKRAKYEVPHAIRAQRRTASVVLVDVDMTDGAAQIALTQLCNHDCSVSSGSRWTTVVRGADKGSAALQWLRAIDNTLPIVAIGDGSNDQPLLSIADHPFVVRRPTGTHHPELANIPKAHLLTAKGTAGWQEMLDVLGDRFGGPP